MTLLEAGTVIQTSAMEMLGTYQGAKPPFEAWAPLNEQTQEQRVRAGYSADEPLFRTGELRESIEVRVAENTVHVGVAGDMATIAAAQEYGTARIPPRPFLRPAAKEALPEVGRIVTGALRRAILED
ncbi:MAG: hypothetical protein GIX03_15145 [Candidatus Eremiobacteraeota bacterium]|nr:hypothetical protein [Candidatus Eremiobacteraeota bacterium]